MARTKNTNKICAMPLCNLLVRSAGFCQSHYQTHNKYDLFVQMIAQEYECEHGVTYKHKSDCARLCHSDVIGRPRHDIPSYQAMHKRIRVAKGSASQYDCVEPFTKPHKAEDWSLDPGEEQHQEWNETRNRWYWYSTDIESYSPRCRHHHRKLDANNPKGGGTYGMED